jgi:hypothetical protein
MLTLLSAETYQHLSVRCGWSTSDCRKWLIEVLTHQLLAGGSERDAKIRVMVPPAAPKRSDIQIMAGTERRSAARKTT